jgi:hypothetical protein
MDKKVINYTEMLTENHQGISGAVYKEIKEHIDNYANNLRIFFQEQQATSIFKTHTPEYYINALLNAYINLEIAKSGDKVSLKFKLAIDAKVFALLCSMSSVLAQNELDPLYVTYISPESLEAANFDNPTYIELCALSMLLHHRNFTVKYKEIIKDIFQAHIARQEPADISQLLSIFTMLTKTGIR